MNRLKKILIIVLSYLLIFAFTAGFTVFMMNRGKVIERGTHEQLMALDGAYKTLVTSE